LWAPRGIPIQKNLPAGPSIPIHPQTSRTYPRPQAAPPSPSRAPSAAHLAPLDPPPRLRHQDLPTHRRSPMSSSMEETSADECRRHQGERYQRQVLERRRQNEAFARRSRAMVQRWRGRGAAMCRAMVALTAHPNEEVGVPSVFLLDLASSAQGARCATVSAASAPGAGGAAWAGASAPGREARRRLRQLRQGWEARWWRWHLHQG
jgi:hypothetical protein